MGFRCASLYFISVLIHASNKNVKIKNKTKQKVRKKMGMNNVKIYIYTQQRNMSAIATGKKNSEQTIKYHITSHLCTFRVYRRASKHRARSPCTQVIVLMICYCFRCRSLPANVPLNERVQTRMRNYISRW